MANKLVDNISAAELTALLEELASTPGVNGPMIQRLARERYGVEIGHNSANHFRATVWEDYKAKLAKRKDLAQMVAESGSDEAGRQLADAASDSLVQMAFEHLMEEPIDFRDEEDRERAEGLSKLITRARSEDRKLIKQMADMQSAATAVMADETLSPAEKVDRMKAIFGR